MKVAVVTGTIRNASGNICLRSARRITMIGSIAAPALLMLGLAGCTGIPTRGLGCSSGATNRRTATPFKVTLGSDDWTTDANDPRRMLARIQSNLDRVAAGQPVWPEPPGDPLLKIVDAYARFLHGDIGGMDAQLALVENGAANIREGNDIYGKPITVKQLNPVASDPAYLAAGHNAAPLVRLYAGIRVVDGALFARYGNPLTGTGLPAGPASGYSPLDGTWLKLPCRTVVGRVSAFNAVKDTLKKLGGPVLDCPIDGPIDYARDAMLALHPVRLTPHVTPPPSYQPAPVENAPASPPTGSREWAIDEMGAHPKQAAPILKRYAHVDALGELDYALFLHPLEPETPTRDATIRELLAKLVKTIKARPYPGPSDVSPESYDGTDTSLVNTIRLASVSGAATSESSFYAIPCAIVIARPGLLAATGMYFGSNMDNFMPRSGCQWGRGKPPPGYPGKAVDAFENASTAADGNFLATFGGTMVYGFEAAQATVDAKMRVDPRWFLEPRPGGPADMQNPYQVWGYTRLNNYATSLRLRKLYSAAREKLAAYYEKEMRLDRADSRQAAKVALFLATFGSDCGYAVPTTSIRRSLLERAPLDQIRKLLADGAPDSPEIDGCAKYAGKDPLLLVAVADPEALPLVLQHEHNVDDVNPIGKTALMEAAQFDRIKVVEWLLVHGARVYDTTWAGTGADGGGLGDDARTALMYAAANGSLQLIKVLLEAGADPYQADTKGYRAIDYLLGYGPTPPNPNLDKRQLAEAARWLF